MPSPTPTRISRRRFVAASAGLAGLMTAGACALPAPGEAPDPFLRLAEAADRDARELAAADASHGAHVTGLRRVAQARRVHAERLFDEIRRRADDDAGAIGTGTGAGPTGTDDSGAATVTCPPIDEVRARLNADARAAGDAAVASEDYRAELAASVSAACTAALEVVLA